VEGEDGADEDVDDPLELVDEAPEALVAVGEELPPSPDELVEETDEDLPEPRESVR
jgi:hypothetical protein